MPKIIKRSDKEEEFSKTKIINSMMNGGISKVTDETVLGSIYYREVMMTTEVRNRIIGGIKNRVSQAVRQFEWHPRKTHKT